MTWLEEFVDGAHQGLQGNLREPLWQRGVSDEQIQLFRIGCLAGARLPHGVQCSPRFTAWWGNHSRQFRNPLVFPLTSTLGNVHGLQFRDLNPRVRGYLDYFESKEEPTFFGLAQAMPRIWSTEEVWLVEGVFDLCPLQRHVPNIVSTMHAGVSKQFARLLRRVARTLLIAYDMDSTGMNVSYDLVREFRDIFEIIVVKFPRKRLPKGGCTKDPNDLWAVWGDAALGEFVHKIRA